MIILFFIFVGVVLASFVYLIPLRNLRISKIIKIVLRLFLSVIVFVGTYNAMTAYYLRSFNVSSPLLENGIIISTYLKLPNIFGINLSYDRHVEIRVPGTSSHDYNFGPVEGDSVIAIYFKPDSSFIIFTLNDIFFVSLRQDADKNIIGCYEDFFRDYKLLGYFSSYSPRKNSEFIVSDKNFSPIKKKEVFLRYKESFSDC